MNSPTTKHVIRMGPITVLSLVIVISLATMGVLSLATAQASERLVEKQQNAQQMIYENERAAQEFVAQVDEMLGQARASGATSEQALASLAAELGAQPASIDAAAEGIDGAIAQEPGDAAVDGAADQPVADVAVDGALSPDDAVAPEADAVDEAAGEMAQAEPVDSTPVVEGDTISKSFTAGTRSLTVKIRVTEDVRYTIEEWKTEASIDSAEETSLWMG